MTSARTTEIGRARRGIVSRVFAVACAAVALLSVAALATLLVTIAINGVTYLDVDFLISMASRSPEDAGFWPAIIGSVWVCLICALAAIPVGVGAAVYLHEFAPKNRWTDLIRVNIANLAGVPSIVYGLIGLAVFVSFLNVFGTGDAQFRIGDPSWFIHVDVPFGRSVLSAGLTLALVVLPIVMIATQEALRGVPDSLREGPLALGATRWQTVRRMVLPCAVPGIMTGSILAMSRAVGETAPILVVGGALFALPPRSIMDPFQAMPIQIFNWTSDTNPEFQRVAATGIIVLLAVLLIFNAIAIAIRAFFDKPLS